METVIVTTVLVSSSILLGYVVGYIQGKQKMAREMSSQILELVSRKSDEDYK